ncbi:MAG: flagellar basal-body rod protein FlgF [Pseudomonadota bacterium]
MDRMVYLAMSAAKQTMQAQAIATNNLANATTVGFKADYDAYRSMPIFGEGMPTRVFALNERPGINFDPGSIETTGNPLDVVVNDRGFFAVQTADGSQAYTRAGNFKLTVTGQLVTTDGLSVLGNGGPIALPQAEEIVIGADGTISIRPTGQDATTLAQLDRLRLVDPDINSLIKGEDGLFRLRDGGVAPVSASVRVTAGALERSNVNPVGELISIIENARNYERAVKAMSTAEENDAQAQQILEIQ